MAGFASPANLGERGVKPAVGLARAVWKRMRVFRIQGSEVRVRGQKSEGDIGSTFQRSR